MSTKYLNATRFTKFRLFWKKNLVVRAALEAVTIMGLVLGCLAAAGATLFLLLWSMHQAFNKDNFTPMLCLIPVALVGITVALAVERYKFLKTWE